jgi:subtilase family serine protease
MACVAALSFLLSACSAAATGPALPSDDTAAPGAPEAAHHRMHRHDTEALPISSRAIPISSRAIPISSRAIPINFAALPQLLNICGLPIVGRVSCGAIRRLDVLPQLGLLPSLIAGYQPSDLASAYNVPQGAAGGTIGIVIAYGDPNAENDLSTYRSTFGLPPCGTSDGCLRFVNGADGSSTLPAGSETWAQELSIDLDMASAICPNCKLLVSEAPSADIEALTTAMQIAIQKGATVVSNSYTTPESATLAADNPKWNHPGTPIVAGAGDSGYGVGWPASSSYVTAVGGTTLLPILSGFAWLETAWGSTGSGCSKYVSKPAWQRDAGCKMRTLNDVAAIANPVPGVSVYDTYFANQSMQGWAAYGGTSVSTPIVAALYAMSANRSGTGASTLYSAPRSGFNDILLGANALCLTYLCTSGLGYDGPTGLGTPNGVAGL